MITLPFEDWVNELMLLGKIVPDEDNSVPQKEKERRINRYCDLIEMIGPEDGEKAFQSVIKSMQVSDGKDYGAYETISRVFSRYTAEAFGQYMARGIVGIIQRMPYQAASFLIEVCPLDESVNAFNQTLATLSAADQKIILDFVDKLEKEDGWVEECNGRIHL